MPQIIFLPHAEHCPDGMVVEAETGKSILEVAHDNHIEIESACGGCAVPAPRAIASFAKVSTR